MRIKLLLLFCISFYTGYAQVCINTKDPKAMLQVEPSSSVAPTGNDGVLIPRVNKFPVTPTAKGQLIYMLANTNTTILDGFYIWDGVIWDPIMRAPYIITEDESLFVAMGSGYALSVTNSNAEVGVNLSSIVGKDLTGFSVTANKIIIGKAGKYFVNFVSGLKTSASSPDALGRRATFEFRLKKNNSVVILSSASIPNEKISATNNTMSNIVTLAAGDEIIITVKKVSETDTNFITYTGFGNNTVKLTFLHD